MFYFRVAKKMIRVIATIEEKIIDIGNSLVVSKDDSSIRKVYMLASEIASMGYDLDLVETEIGVGLKIYTSPDEIGEVLAAIKAAK